MIEEGVAARAVRTDIPPALITAHIVRTLGAAMRDWAVGRAAEVGRA